jgi:hypothetical protein
MLFGMWDLSRYMAAIGRRGGIRSRRNLAPETARRMVAIREANRALRRAAAGAASRPDGTPADTTASAQAVQDALVRRMSPADKLARVARLSRMVDRLAVAGIEQRYPDAGRMWIRIRHTEQRLGRDLAAKVYDWSTDD